MSPRALLFVTVFNSILGLSVLFPILAPLGRSLDLSEVQIGSLSTTYALMQFVLSPYWGRRSERVGRKPVILIGVLGFAAAFFLFGAVAHFGLRGALGPGPVFAGLLVARVIGGAFSSATLPTAQAYIADTTERADRTAGMALVGAAFGLGIVFGPAIGALLAGLSLLAPVYFSAGFALLNAVFVWLFLPDTTRRVLDAPKASAPALSGRVWPLLTVGFAVTLASVAMEQTVAFYYQDRLSLAPQQTARTVGAALVCYGVVAVLVQGFIVRRVRWSPLVLLRVGVPIALLGFVGLVLSKDFWSMTLALSIQGFGQGLALPGVSAALSLAVDDDEQGAVAGLSSSSSALGRMLGPLAGAGLYQLHPTYPYMFSAGLLGVVLVVLILGARRTLAPSR